MDNVEIQISFDRDPPVYGAGETVAGRASLTTFETIAVRRVEVSVLWYTVGKGTEDQGVIFLEEVHQDETLFSATSLPFQAQLPALPLSYQGRLINIHWVVRARIYPKRGKSFGAEARFQLLAADSPHLNRDNASMFSDFGT